MEIYQKDFDKEKEFLHDIYLSDSKNYHAWSYRLWFVERFQLWDGELEFVNEELSGGQFTNNSLWSYRYFLLMKTREFNRELVKNEINYALNLLMTKNPNNEAAWVYMKGLLA